MVHRHVAGSTILAIIGTYRNHAAADIDIGPRQRAQLRSAKSRVERGDDQANLPQHPFNIVLSGDMVKARQEAGLTQAQVAERMGTKPPAVAGLEASLSSSMHSPSMDSTVTDTSSGVIGAKIHLRVPALSCML